MRINQVIDAAKLAFASETTLALVGKSGIAKTSIFKQIYRDLGFNHLIIIRPSLLSDSADLVGMPLVIEDESGNRRTSFITPEFLPKLSDKTLIVLDEINRIQKDVANAIFGLIEAEGPTVGSHYALPIGCKVVATLNPPTDDHQGVLDLIDQAWISRLCFVKITNDFQAFKEYGKKSGKVTDKTLKFFEENPSFFGSADDFDVEMFGMNIKNNNRSKQKVSLLQANAEEMNIDDSVVFEMIRGIGGLEFAKAYISFIKDYKDDVSLDLLLNNSNYAIDLDYDNLSNVSKLIDDLNDSIKKGNIVADNYKNLSEFFMRIPVDTLFGYISTHSIIQQESIDAGNVEDVNMNNFLDLFEQYPDIIKRLQVEKV